MPALYDRHLDRLDARDRAKAESLLKYSFGRLKQKMKQDEEAMNFFRMALRGRNRHIQIKFLLSLTLLQAGRLFKT